MKRIAVTGKDTLAVPGATTAAGNGDGSRSPRIGGPGSAFKPYASSENLFDPSNFRKEAAAPAVGASGASMVVMANQNYPLANGSDLTKLTDSRYFMQQRPPPHHGHPSAESGSGGGPQMPFHHKAVRDLRKQVLNPVIHTLPSYSSW